jgi:Squalene/phytoene synthase
MAIIERLYAPISERPNPDAIDAFYNKDNAIALRRRAAESSFLGARQLLPIQRRQAMYALYDFCREVDDIADARHRGH